MADLGAIRGHERAGFRPVLILQNDIWNKSLNTVIIAPLTKKLEFVGYSTTYFINKKLSGLKLDSVVLLYQIRALDKSKLKNKVSSLDSATLKRIKIQMSLLF